MCDRWRVFSRVTTILLASRTLSGDAATSLFLCSPQPSRSLFALRGPRRRRHESSLCTLQQSSRYRRGGIVAVVRPSLLERPTLPGHHRAAGWSAGGQKTFGVTYRRTPQSAVSRIDLPFRLRLFWCSSA